MNARIKLLSMVGTVLAAGAIASSPMLASASDGDIDAAVFVGQTTSLSPAVQLVGGTGTYAFTTTGLVCLGIVSTDTTPPEVAQNCSLTSTGAYNNTVCGTGTADGSATTTEADGASETVNYHIQFASGIGIVLGSNGVPPSTSVLGVVVLLPTSPATPPACVNGFTVAGVAVITN